MEYNNYISFVGDNFEIFVEFVNKEPISYTWKLLIFGQVMRIIRDLTGTNIRH